MFTRLQSLRSLSGLLTHYSLSTSLLLGASALASPWMLMGGAGAAAVAVGLSSLLVTRGFEQAMKGHPPRHKFSPNLQKMVDELYARSGLSQERNVVYDFAVNPQKNTNIFSNVVDLVMQQIMTTPNAMASHLTRPVIMISEPLLELLDDDEEYAVLAHEFAHACAQHSRLKLPSALLSATANVSAGLAVLTQMIAAGWMPLGLALGARALSSNIKEQMKEHLPHDTLKELTFSRRVQKGIDVATKGINAGIFTYFSPAFLPVWLAARGIGFGSQLLSKTLSRSMEYQADRGAVLLGADPLAMIRAFRKLDAVGKQSLKEAWHPDPLPEKRWAKKAWERMMATHPTIKKRIGEMEEMARAQGYEAAQIEAAKTGPLNIPKTVRIPGEHIRAMVSQFVGSQYDNELLADAPGFMPALTKKKAALAPSFA